VHHLPGVLTDKGLFTSSYNNLTSKDQSLFVWVSLLKIRVYLFRLDSGQHVWIKDADELPLGFIYGAITRSYKLKEICPIDNNTCYYILSCSFVMFIYLSIYAITVMFLE
jgi:hypothetical protein